MCHPCLASAHSTPLELLCCCSSKTCCFSGHCTLKQRAAPLLLPLTCVTLHWFVWSSPSDPVSNNKGSSGTAAPQPHPDTFPPVGRVSPRRSGALGEGWLCFLAETEDGLAGISVLCCFPAVHTSLGRMLPQTLLCLCLAGQRRAWDGLLWVLRRGESGRRHSAPSLPPHLPIPIKP